MKAVVVAHGDVDPRDRAELKGADLIVAANGGTLALERWGVLPQAVVGDLDSLGLERAGTVGDVVTLLALRGNAEGVRTQGLRYPLAGETLPFGAARGLSNVVVSRPASVACDRGVLLVIETASGGVA